MALAASILHNIFRKTLDTLAWTLEGHILRTKALATFNFLHNVRIGFVYGLRFVFFRPAGGKIFIIEFIIKLEENAQLRIKGGSDLCFSVWPAFFFTISEQHHNL
jgi:hypothetical protein